MLVGEPEAGKSWLALLATAERLSIGQRVLFIDFENTATEIVGRLRDLGVDDKFIFGLFVYVRPQDPLDIDIATIAPDAALAVLHGTTDAMLLHGLKLTDNNDVAELLRRLARPLADAGAAVLLADHVTKDREGRGRWALGAQHKMAGTDVTYALDAIRPFARGLSGLSKLTVSKDRPGFVRAVSVGGKLVGEVRFISDPDGQFAITISPASENEDGGFRPTAYMERVSRFLESQSGTVSLRIIRANVSGKAEYIGEAARRLAIEGFASMADGPRGSVLYTSIKPFREEA